MPAGEEEEVDGDEDEEVAADCAMDSVDCGERESGPLMIGYGRAPQEGDPLLIRFSAA